MLERLAGGVAGAVLLAGTFESVMAGALIAFWTALVWLFLSWRDALKTAQP